jgi:hypothetical protein
MSCPHRPDKCRRGDFAGLFEIKCKRDRLADFERLVGERAVFSTGIGRGVDALLREGREGLRVANRGRVIGAFCVVTKQKGHWLNT